VELFHREIVFVFFQISKSTIKHYFCNMILVTGATGLVGSHLILALLENHSTVRAIFRNEDAKQKTRDLFQLYNKEAAFYNIQWIQADITEVPTLEAAFENIEQVYHCAALISFDPKDEEALRKTNIEGTANVVNFCIEHQIKKLCYVSSIAALGDLKEHETIITEETEWNPELPHSDYAISKYGAEMEVWRGKQEGLEVLIVNPGVVIGPGFWNAGSGALFSKIHRGMLFYTSGITGFICVHDVVACMIYLMGSTTTEDRFCLVGDHLSFEVVLKNIANGLGVRQPILLASPLITAMAWRIDWVFSFFFGKKRTLSKLMVKSLHQKHHYSTEKLKLIYSTPFSNIESCISNTAKYFPKK
jgi:dihydroflavonol-4-reductase